jgi:hypothetical protein
MHMGMQYFVADAHCMSSGCGWNGLWNIKNIQCFAFNVLNGGPWLRCFTARRVFGRTFSKTVVAMARSVSDGVATLSEVVAVSIDFEKVVMCDGLREKK